MLFGDFRVLFETSIVFLAFGFPNICCNISCNRVLARPSLVPSFVIILQLTASAVSSIDMPYHEISCHKRCPNTRTLKDLTGFDRFSMPICRKMPTENMISWTANSSRSHLGAFNWSIMEAAGAKR